MICQKDPHFCPMNRIKGFREIYEKLKNMFIITVKNKPRISLGKLVVLSKKGNLILKWLLPLFWGGMGGSSLLSELTVDKIASMKFIYSGNWDSKTNSENIRASDRISDLQLAPLRINEVVVARRLLRSDSRFVLVTSFRPSSEAAPLMCRT